MSSISKDWSLRLTLLIEICHRFFLLVHKETTSRRKIVINFRKGDEFEWFTSADNPKWFFCLLKYFNIPSKLKSKFGFVKADEKEVIQSLLILSTNNLFIWGIRRVNGISSVRIARQLSHLIFTAFKYFFYFFIPLEIYNQFLFVNVNKKEKNDW